jgi:glycine/D-amino acid oxidase-like deaminating enzyme
VAPGLGFREEGNLFLVSDRTRERALESFRLQRSLGREVDWLSREEVEASFPLYRLRDYVAATWGPADGHLDCYSFLMAYRRKAESLGAQLLHGEVTAVQTSRGRAEGVGLGSGERLSTRAVVSCAGAWAGGLARQAGVDLPVVPICRQVFVVDPEEKPGLPLPLTNLPDGLYFRSEGDGSLLVGKSLSQDPETTDLIWDRRRFQDRLWPELATFVPVFDRLKLRRGWAGLYAVNTLDGNAILGQWPELQGFYLANGFSGHGLQQAPAVGRYLAERILGREPVLDLSLLGPERILIRRPLEENYLV